MKKTVSYVRNSTDLQKNSIDMQEQYILQASIREVLPIDEEYVDRDVSARKNPINKRPKLHKMLREIENDKIGTLIVYKRDRLARKVTEWIEIYRLLRKKNIKVVFAAENEFPLHYSEMGEINELHFGAMIEQEGERIVERLIATRITNFLDGKTAGQLPFGYSVENETRKIVREEEKLTTVKKIYDEINSEKYTTLKELKETLDAKGLTRDGEPWKTHAIKNLIKNPTYMGLRVLNIDKKRFEKEYGQLTVITEEEWSKAQDILDKIAPEKGKPKVDLTEFPTLLDNLLLCEKCRKPLIPNKPQKVENYKYQCQDHKEVSINKEKVEETVSNAAINFFNRLVKSNFQGLVTRNKNENLKKFNEMAKQQETQINRHKKRLVQNAEKWLDETSDHRKKDLEKMMINSYVKVVNEKSDDEKLGAELNFYKNLNEKVEYIQKKLLNEEIFQQLSVVRKKELLADVIHHVIVTPHVIKIVFKHPFFEVKEARNDVTL